MSDPVIIGVAVILMIVIITIAAIMKYPEVGAILQLWAAFGTLTGAMATYFFTREQVQRQEAQTQMYRAAFETSQKQKAQAGEQFLEIAEKLKSDVISPQNQQLLERYENVAKGLAKPTILINKNGDAVLFNGLPPFASPPDRRP